jgi:hypothetical protein
VFPKVALGVETFFTVTSASAYPTIFATKSFWRGELPLEPLSNRGAFPAQWER